MTLATYPAESITNRQFSSFDLARWDAYYLPPGLTALVDAPPRETATFIEDDNRSAILPYPIATLDDQPFYLSVKGVGSAVDPFSFRPLDRAYAAELTSDAQVRERLQGPVAQPPGGIITGELWLRGSPYGGQGLEHATTALRVSERADLTSIEGFRIAPVVKICFLPLELEERLRSIHWYRTFRGRLVQELRLVPSNVRIYFHGRTTVGENIAHVFDLFSIDSVERAQRFETNFVRSAVALLTLYARTLTFDVARNRYSGLDLHDVWLDKDAVLAPDGSAYFVDLEGIAPVALEKSDVKEKIEDQVYRSLYEFMFAYEQIERERARRFGAVGNRKRQFESTLHAALADDPYVRLSTDRAGVEILIRNRCAEESLYLRFPLVD